MIPVSEIWSEVVELLSSCDTDVVFRRLNRAVELLANKSDWDPLKGWMDISCDEALVTLPAEIETPLMISYGRYPAIGRNQLYRMHLNGPGDRDEICTNWRWWEDGPEVSTMREIATPTAVAAIACSTADVGQVVWVYGFDANQKKIRTQVNGEYQDGYPITLQVSLIEDENAPLFSRITRVRKPVTEGPVSLWTVSEAAASDSGSSTSPDLDTLLAVYEHHEEEPRFRRLQIDRASADLVRIHFRRRNFKLRSQTDLIPLHSSEAIVMMVRALKYYAEPDFASAQMCEATAVRWLEEEQETRNPNIQQPLQINDLPKVDDDIN